MARFGVNGNTSRMADSAVVNYAADVVTNNGATIEEQIKAAAQNGQRIDPYAGGIQLFRNSIPSSDGFDYLLMPQGAVDIVWWDYWDSAALTSGAATNTKLFTTAKDQTYNGNLLGANGTLQGTEKFLIYSWRVELENDSTTSPLDAVDVKEIFRVGVVELWVQNKIYKQSSMMSFLNPEAPLLLNTNYFQQNPFMSQKLAIQVPIGTRNSFYVQVSTTSPTLSGNWRIKVYLTGALYRGVQ